MVRVSINSTSEEVRSLIIITISYDIVTKFPLIQLPRKSEDKVLSPSEYENKFPLIQLPRKSEEWGSENLAPRGL